MILITICNKKINAMKKIALFIVWISWSCVAVAQQTIVVNDRITEEEEKKPKTGGGNIIKVNLPALAFKNYSLQYERKLTRRITLAATFRYMPTDNLPFLDAVNRYANDPELERQLNNIQFGNMAIMPELRFYIGKKGAFRGFYFAPYANIARYETSLQFEYDDQGITKNIPLSGNLNTLSGGLMLGAQWKLSKALYLDWWILGANYGNSDGTISGRKTLTANEQQAIRDQLGSIDNPLTQFTYDVNNNGATVFFNGPWLGIRGGLCLGIRF